MVTLKYTLGSKSLIFGLVFMLMLLMQTQALTECALEQVEVFNQDTRTLSCLQCPANCFTCTESSPGVATCTGCKSSFYLTGSKECLPCEPNCAECKGPGVDACLYLQPGWYFNPQSRKIESCPTGCDSCNDKGQCTLCRSGYLSTPVMESNTKNQLKVQGHNIVQCSPCTISNCDSCYKNEFGVEICSNCKAKHGIDPATKACFPCPAGCVMCDSNSQICSFCTDSLQKNPVTGLCEPIGIPNCMDKDLKTGKCNWCKSGYAVEPTLGISCISCAEADPLCNQCNPNPAAANPFMDSIVKRVTCTSCPSRLYLDESTSTCKYCGPHCLFCSNDKNCASCDPSYRVNSNNACEPIPPENNCDYFSAPNVCSSCRSGNYIDLNGTCKPCHESCLYCSGPGSTECASCSVGYFMKTKDSSGSVEDTNAYDVLRPYSLECVKTCPDGYEADSFSRTCIKSSKPVVVEKYAFSRTAPKNWLNLQQDSFDFVLRFSKYITEFNDNQLAKIKQNPELVQGTSKECSYKGVLEEKVSVNRETIYKCSCIRGYHGKFCFVDNELYSSIQSLIMGFGYDIASLGEKVEEKSLLRIIQNLCRGLLSMDSLSLVFFSLEKSLQSLKYRVNEASTFLGALDGLLKAHYSEKEDLERIIGDGRQDIDNLNYMQIIYKELFKLIQLGFKVVGSSMGTQEQFLSSPSSAFQSRLIDGTMDLFRGEKFQYIIPSDLLGQGTNYESIGVKITNYELAGKYKSVKLFAWAFSNLLFRRDRDSFASQILAFQVLSPTGEVNLGPTQSSDELHIKFPIKHLPSKKTIGHSFNCLMLQIENNAHKVIQTEDARIIEHKETGKPFVECKFKNYKFGWVFYAVGHVGKDHQKSVGMTAVHRAALDENESFTFKKQYTDLTASQLLLSVGVAMVAFVLSLYTI